MTKKQVQKVINQLNKTNLDHSDPATTVWLARHLGRIRTTMNQSVFLENQGKTTQRLRPGKMFFFGYDPLTKAELNFWDEFPIVLLLDFTEGGFLGLNLHYLPPTRRALFLNNLLTEVSSPDWSKKTPKGKPANPESFFKITYPMLKNRGDFKLFKYCIKRYYLRQIVTKISVIPPTEWKMVPFFPLDRFKGQSRASIWSLVR
jgi:hypothetical protein